MDTATVRRSKCEAFIAYLTHERNDSEHTVKAYQRDLNAFQDFCDDYFGGADAIDAQAGGTRAVSQSLNS